MQYRKKKEQIAFEVIEAAIVICIYSKDASAEI